MPLVDVSPCTLSCTASQSVSSPQSAITLCLMVTSWPRFLPSVCDAVQMSRCMTMLSQCWPRMERLMWQLSHMLTKALCHLAGESPAQVLASVLSVAHVAKIPDQFGIMASTLAPGPLPPLGQEVLGSDTLRRQDCRLQSQRRVSFAGLQVLQGITAPQETARRSWALWMAVRKLRRMTRPLSQPAQHTWQPGSRCAHAPHRLILPTACLAYRVAAQKPVLSEEIEATQLSGCVHNFVIRARLRLLALSGLCSMTDVMWSLERFLH